MELGLQGKTGIITGASRGIGAAIARELMREGCSLALAARNIDSQEKQDTAGTARILPYPTDLTEADSADKLVQATLSAFDRIDFVVCNAGVAKQGAFTSLTDQDWADGFALKFFGHVRLLRAAWPHLVQSKGSVVVIAGYSGRTPGLAGTVTGAVNAALLNLTKGLAAQGIVEGVRVNAINPGSVRTERFMARIKQAAAELDISEAEALARKRARDAPATRIGEPDDIAGLVAFILSRRGVNLHGAIIDCDAGKTRTL